MTNPNTDVWLSLLRAAVIAICTVLVTKGVISAADAPAIQTALLTLLPTLVAAGAAWWGGRTHTNDSKILAIQSMPAAVANQAVESLPTVAKSQIRLATLPDETILAAAAAMPDVTKIEVKGTATNGVAKAAADVTQPKIVSEGAKP